MKMTHAVALLFGSTFAAVTAAHLAVILLEKAVSYFLT